MWIIIPTFAYLLPSTTCSSRPNTPSTSFCKPAVFLLLDTPFAMLSSALHSLLLLVPIIAAPISAQSGYVGYSLTHTGNEEDSVLYATDSTPANVSTTTPPDVYLNATVNVGEIDITVTNLTAMINLQASVLQLLQFNAGIDVSIQRVSLQIKNVSANVVLEARLENLVLMINDTLNSLDLNPVLATLGQDVGTLADTAVSGLTGSTQSSSVVPRSYDLANNILYSVNDYSGNTHTNRVLTQSGSIVDESLNNDGTTLSQKVVGSYAQDMTFNGYNQSVVKNGQAAHELEYTYSPFPGLQTVVAIYVNEANDVVEAQVLSESSAGGSSTVGGSTSSTS